MKRLRQALDAVDAALALGNRRERLADALHSVVAGLTAAETIAGSAGPIATILRVIIPRRARLLRAISRARAMALDALYLLESERVHAAENAARNLVAMLREVT